MPITAKLDEFGKPAWIALIVLGFMAFWPMGLAILAFTIWSGRMGCGYHGGSDRWQHKMERMQRKMDWMRAKMGGGSAGWFALAHGWSGAPSSGNRAFDDYRSETLKRLEEEQREFKRFPRAAALRQGQDRVRRIHGRAPQPSGAGRSQAPPPSRLTHELCPAELTAPPVILRDRPSAFPEAGGRLRWFPSCRIAGRRRASLTLP